jgi:hypothetical protein
LVQAQWARQGVRNLEAVELGLREAVYRDLSRVLEQLLNDADLPIPENSGRPGEKCHRSRPKEFLSLFGPVGLQLRHYYYSGQSQGRVPLDEALGLINGYSPGVVRFMCRAAARDAFGSGAADLKAYTGLEIDSRQFQRLVNLMGPVIAQTLAPKPLPGQEAARISIFYLAIDGTGVPMRKEELQGVAGKQEDGSAKTAEIKICASFTQTKTDEEGRPMRDPGSTSYLVSFDPAADFGSAVRQEAIGRGMSRAQRVVVLGDGAAWIWKLAADKFPFAVQILDLFHTLEHLEGLAKLLYSPPLCSETVGRWKEWLFEDKVQAVIDQGRGEAKRFRGDKRQDALKALGYLENNKTRMLYGTYRAKGYFYGSGVVEAGCRTVIGQRLKESGMFWGKTGALNVARLRCALLDERFDHFWDERNQTKQFNIQIAHAAA